MARVTGYQKLFAARQKELARARAENPPPARPPAIRKMLVKQVAHTMADIKALKDGVRILEHVFETAGVVRDVEVHCGPVKGGPVTAALHYNGFFVRNISLAEGVQRIDFSGHVMRPGDRVEVFARSDPDATIKTLAINFRFEAIP